MTAHLSSPTFEVGTDRLQELVLVLVCGRSCTFANLLQWRGFVVSYCVLGKTFRILRYPLHWPELILDILTHCKDTLCSAEPEEVFKGHARCPQCYLTTLKFLLAGLEAVSVRGSEHCFLKRTAKGESSCQDIPTLPSE